MVQFVPIFAHPKLTETVSKRLCLM
jgi:hypothetical protein